MSGQPTSTIASIDAEHGELIALFRQFDELIKTGAPAEAVQQIVERALDCANAHFAHEEELIAQTNYPGAEEHKFLHRHLRMEFATLAGDTMSAHTCDPATLENLDKMRAMLTEHITGPDRELAEYLKAAGIE